MKNNIIVYLMFICFISSCARDDNMIQQDTSTAYFTVDEARNFFEDSFSNNTRSISNDNIGVFSVGEFTPQWDNALTSECSTLASVDVPILTEYKYRAIQSDFGNGKSNAYIVEVSQKMVIVKSKDTDKKAEFILTLIPNKDFYSKNKGDISNKFLNTGDKGNFSGMAIYSQNGIPMRINKYLNGEKIVGISVIGLNEYESVKTKFDLIISELREIKIQYTKSSISTRSYGGEDDWWDYDEDDYWSIGDDYYVDSDGDIYWDYDGDGKPDTWVVPDVVVEPDPEPEYCPECGSAYCNGECMSSNPCDYCGSELCSGECQDEEYNDEPDTYECPRCGDPYCDGSCVSGGSSGGSEDNENSDENYLLPKDLSNLHGDSTYYYERYVDAKNRFGKLNLEIEPPTYYEEYGTTYYNKFQDKKSSLSAKGAE